MRALLRHLSWPELRHHPWRNLAALVAVMLGVALAFSVHLINASALSEFSAAVRSVNGEADVVLRGPHSGFDEALYERVAAHPGVTLASPVIETEAWATTASGKRVAVRILGIDALVARGISPALQPTPHADAHRMALLSPDAVFLNATAQQLLGERGEATFDSVLGPQRLHISGAVAIAGTPLALMDIAGAQQHFGTPGLIDRIDVRLATGTTRASLLAGLALPADVHAADPAEAAQRVSNVSRAYRVNLTVLALVALFTGAFLVFSILSLSVSRRQPQFALLGVLGLSGRERLHLVVAESALLGVVGSLLGIALGTALAAAALQLLAGDLGGGYFPGVAPTLQFSVWAALAYGALGAAAAVAGGWLPARAAQRLAPAQALKGLGADTRHLRPWLGPALMAAGAGLALLPPVAGLPLAAYASVACLLAGGIACVPAGLAALLALVPAPRHALALLAIERARHQRRAATVAVAGVVASLSLAVALTVMVASFRDSVTRWLDTVLPADLYVRAAAGDSGATRQGDLLLLPVGIEQAAASAPGVLRARAQRVVPMTFDERRPAVALISHPIGDPAQSMPLIGELLPPSAGTVAAYVSEAMVDLYRASPGTTLQLPLPNGMKAQVHVRGVWRDYARQHGAVMIDEADYRRLTGDLRANDLAVWLQPGADPLAVQATLRSIAARLDPAGAAMEFSSPGEIRTMTLRIFDRSFAVTYWLQAVAIGIGLFGIAASGSAQVLARRKEFGLLSHLGLTRAQVLWIVAAEGAVSTAVGAAFGLLLGIAVSVVLVKVVNPQSFHWTMDLLLPWVRLLPLCAAVLLAGTLTAWATARSAASRQMALAVKEDW